MSINRASALTAAFSALVIGLQIVGPQSTAHAQSASHQSVHFRVRGANQRLEMTVNTSRILTVEHKVPRLLVQNTEILQATPLSPNEIQVSALKPGVTTVNLWDEENNIHVVDVRVLGDVRELADNITLMFPDANVSVRPLSASLVLTGYVPRPEMVGDIVSIAEDYYPKVINHVKVGGTQTVLLHVKVMEVNRNKLRQFGIDWTLITGDDFIVQSVAGLTSAIAPAAGLETIRFGVFEGNTQFGAFIDALRQNNLAKLLAEPTLVATSGRPASFNSGGEIPIIVSNGLNGNSIEFREFGTTLDFVPIVLGNGMIKLEVRPQVTEIDPSLSVNGTPGFRSRRVETGVEMRAGQTLALAGFIFNRTEAESRGLPWVSELPWVGAAFRRVREQTSEVELLVLVTPELVHPLEPHEVPPGPGQSTTSPCDVDLFWRGYLEVPTCCPDGSCPACRGEAGALPAGPGAVYEEIQSPAEQATEGQTSGTRNVPAFQQSNYPSSPLQRPASPYASPYRQQMMQPAGTPASAPSQYIRGSNGQYIPSARQEASQSLEQRRDSQEATPTLIGPIGYDVLN